MTASSSSSTNNSIFSSLRRTWLRRNTVFLASVFSVALVAEIAVDGGVERFWEWNNRGKLWKDLEAKLQQSEDNEQYSQIHNIPVHMEGIEKSLSELEKMSAATEARLSAVSKSIRHNPPRCLVLVNEPDRLADALKWLKSHKIDPASISLIQKFSELSTPVVLKPTQDVIVPPFLNSIINDLQSSNVTSFIIYAVPPLELTATAVNLLHTDIDLVVVVGCHCLTRREYEDVTEFIPLVEEIVLKEAIQPVILFK